jgi:hypothetical protein
MKEKGAFIVFKATADPKDIEFHITDTEPSENQLNLKDQVERTLVVLKSIFSGDDNNYNIYFNQLLSLAQAGLVGEQANPEVARRALLSLQNEVLSKQGGIIKNRYMQKLGIAAAIFGGVSLILGLFLKYCIMCEISSNFLFLWTGCMVGVWLSFGIRKTILTFENLHILEEDRMEPIIRLIFAGLLTVTIGLLFALKIISVKIGSVNSEDLISNSLLALLIGILCGVVEKTLAIKVKKQADQFIQVDKENSKE